MWKSSWAWETGFLEHTLTSIQSRHLFNVFKVGRDAYNEQKKKINSERSASSTGTPNKPNRPPARAYTIDDAASLHSGRSHRSHRSHHSQRPHHHERSRGAEGIRSPPEGVRSSHGMASDDANIPAGTPFYEAFPEMMPPPRRHSTFHARPGAPPHAAAPPQPQWFYGGPPSQPGHGQSPYPEQQQYGQVLPPPPAPTKAPAALIRRSTTNGKHTSSASRHRTSQSNRPNVPRRNSYSGIDMDLAYGPVPPDLLYPGSPSIASTPAQDEEALRGLVGKANFLLDEAQCLRHSATQTIAHLQKSPDAMAAVGLTLAEISNLVKKMGPGVLTNLKSISPAVFGLLAHPHFLVAVGVATGVTIVAFGGYKIVKRIQERSQMQSVGDEGMLPVEDVSRIDAWRRGIAEEVAHSDGTSVDGELITPMARKLSRMNLAEDRRDRERRDREGAGGRDRAAKSKAAPRSVVSTRSKRSSSEPAKPRKSASGAKSTASRTTRTKPEGFVRDKKYPSKAKEAKPSPLRKLLLV